MNDSPENELLSAYLDGELTADEQAQVEQLLAKSPKARQLLDDLRALSNTLQSLPQRKLGEDLSAQVLRAAERKMLTGQQTAAAEQSADAAWVSPRTDAAQTRRTLKSTLRGMLSRRAIMWTAISVAVAIVFMIQDQEALRFKGPLAQRDENTVPAEKTVPAETAATDHAEDAEFRQDAAKQPATDEPFVAPAFVAAPSTAEKASETKLNAAADKAPGIAAAPSRRDGFGAAGHQKPYKEDARLSQDNDDLAMKRAQGSPSEPLLRDASAGGGDGSGKPSKSQGESVAFSLGKPAASVPADDSETSDSVPSDGIAGRAESGARGGGLEGGLGSGQSRGLGPRTKGPQGMTAPAIAAAPRREASGKGNADGSKDVSENRPIGGVAALRLSEAQSQGVLIVQCEISREAAAQNVLDQLLTQEKLTPQVAANGQTPAKGSALKGEAKEGLQDGKKELRTSLGGLDLICVEATAEQLDAAIEKMAAAPEQFLAVSMEPPAGQSLHSADAGVFRAMQRNLTRQSAEADRQAERQANPLRAMSAGGAGAVPGVMPSAPPQLADRTRKMGEPAKADDEKSKEIEKEKEKKAAQAKQVEPSSDAVESNAGDGAVAGDEPQQAPQPKALAVADMPAVAAAPAAASGAAPEESALADPAAGPAASTLPCMPAEQSLVAQQPSAEKAEGQSQQAIRYRVLFVVRVADAPANASMAAEKAKTPPAAAASPQTEAKPAETPSASKH